MSAVPEVLPHMAMFTIAHFGRRTPTLSGELGR